jgi:hypothetical protein
MQGRYGIDELYKFSLVLTLVLIVAEIIVNLALPDNVVTSYIELALSILVFSMYAWMIFRSFSRNIYKRRLENQRFLKIKRVIGRFFSFNVSRKSKSRNKDDNFYIFRDCTKCRSTLRLPRKKGRNRVKCPRCSHSFYVK